MADVLAIVPGARQHSVATHADTARFKCRFDVGSGTSERVYRISFDAAPNAGYWTCSCPGNIRHGNCKHLTAMGLPGRKQRRSLACEEWRQRLA